MTYEELREEVWKIMFPNFSERFGGDPKWQGAKESGLKRADAAIAICMKRAVEVASKRAAFHKENRRRAQAAGSGEVATLDVMRESEAGLIADALLALGGPE